MKTIIFTITLLLTLNIFSLAKAVTITYYYSERCEHCQFLAPYWQQFASENEGKYQFMKKQTDSDANNKTELLNLYMQYRGLAHSNIPAVLVTNNEGREDVLLSGVEEINHLPAILGENTMLIPGMQPREVTAAIITSNGKMPSSLLYPFTLAALADASNPCALFVFIVATSYASIYCGRRTAVMYAVTFCATMFTVYLVAGLAGKRIISMIFGASPWVTLLLSLGILVLALFHIRTAMFPDKTKYSELPHRVKELIIKYAGKMVSFGGAIASGVLCALVEMPCTGGPYIFALNIIATMPFKKAVMWLIYYNFIFISPLLVCLIILLAAPHYIQKLDAWRIAYRRWMHLAMGVLLLLAAAMGMGKYI
ncbi:MAG: hypothetical protein LLG02_10115 [Pelosinus sp.]|nr:hypothetical protein [Pelosinus sp.]